MAVTEKSKKLLFGRKTIKFVYKRISLYNSVNGVDHTVAGNNIEGGDISLAGSASDLDELAAVSGDGLATGGLKGCLTRGNVLALEGSAWNNMTEEDSSQSFFVSQKTVQGICGNLVKSRVGRGKDCEGTLTGKGINKTSSLDSSQQGGELRGGDHKLSNVLGGSLLNYDGCGCMVNSRLMMDSLMVDRGVMNNGTMMNRCVVTGGVHLVLCLERGSGSVVYLAMGLGAGDSMVVSLV